MKTWIDRDEAKAADERPRFRRSRNQVERCLFKTLKASLRGLEDRQARPQRRLLERFES
jgi:hypothetical protein